MSQHSHLLQASVCALQAQLLQQPSLEGLPDVLLHRILCIVWDARPASDASSEVLLALSLQCVSRRFQQVLRAHPLQLRLDFSNTQLANRHLVWLALPAWKDHVTSLTLYNWLAPACEARSRNFLASSLCAENDVVSPLLTVLLANQRGSLRQLLGMPLRLGGVKEAAEPMPDRASMSFDQFIKSTRLQYVPPVDLSTFHLTHLGVPVGYIDALQFDKLPQTMVSLAYRAAHGGAHVSFWLPGAAAWVDVNVSGGSLVVDLKRSRALDGWHANIEGVSVLMVVRSLGLYPPSQHSMFTGMKEVRIHTRRVTIYYFPHAGEEKMMMDMVLDLLCPPCLVSMEIISGSAYPTIGEFPGQHNIPNGWRAMMLKMMDAHERQFAFEIDDGLRKRAAWRRWPARGTQEHDAACRLHQAARNWAAA